MVLQFNKRDYYDWCLARIDQPYKLKNAVHIKNFLSHINSISNTTTGILTYYDKYTSFKHISYNEGTPVFNFFKVVPNKYFIKFFKPDDLHKNHSIDKNIINTLKGFDLRKYNTVEHNNFEYKNYILVFLQKHDEQLDFIASISNWASSNNMTVVFKVHPLSMSNTSMCELVYRYGNKYVIFVDNVNNDILINNALAIWTWNSGSAFSAIMSFKPVCYFLKDYDHTYGPAAKFCTSIEEAASGYHVNKEEVMQYLSWYYHTFIINIYEESAVDKLTKRFNNYFCYNYTIEELFDENSAFK